MMGAQEGGLRGWNSPRVYGEQVERVLLGREGAAVGIRPAGAGGRGALYFL